MPLSNYTLDNVSEPEYGKILSVWESSVKATHDFLIEEDFEFYKNLIPQYLGAVTLKSLKDENGQILGFMGTADGNLEMLFVHAEARGLGVGKILLTHALENENITKVDVNRDNTQAIGFYEKFGFHTVASSEVDGCGKPYPILHMMLAKDKR
ncbi:MAG: GNAT family N-acetyltransferase [Flavobacterium sp.]|uniref:GNAT family N-acetyltransferase n=1 Tax=Flavobacterium sp. Leaf359 TaxID=1736351 RepID=UPI0006F57F97|nr:GNAT family N-acetyltransferase [Flavobacterium sp. Leaf359]KQS47393.1 GCN5 family acetyltransferase [Flavobacterium sp. Leaf359]MBU7569865.1 GNAT family N-acetyltransferase [Flavobacterium sp.]